MGLREDPKRNTIVRRTAHWGVPLALGVVGVLAEAAGDVARGWLRFDREAIAAGEWWRLLSGHVVHLGASHLVLNVAALLLLWWLVGASLPLAGWFLIVASSIACIDLGLWFLESDLSWYVGLSGLLHGLLAAGLLAGFRTAPVESWLLGGLLGMKIVVEQLIGPLPGSEAAAGGAVVVNAHLYGAVGGLAAALALRGRVGRGVPI